MSIVVLGLNHKSAPLEIRERMAFHAQEVPTALEQLHAIDPQGEFVLLSTCNRVELYYAGEQKADEIAGRLIEFHGRFHQIEPEVFRSALYLHENEDAVRHLLLVSAGLDSMVLGEAQILGQVKESYKTACAAKTSGKILNRLFHHAFSVAKSVHTRTSISNGRVSVAGVAVELAQQLFNDMAGARVVVIGAGSTGELVVQHLLEAGCTDVTVVNRSYERGEDLAQKHGIAVGRWDQLDHADRPRQYRDLFGGDTGLSVHQEVVRAGRGQTQDGSPSDHRCRRSPQLRSLDQRGRGGLPL